MWLDMKGDCWGIECDDPAMTFDGHFICLFPRRADEINEDGSHERASAVIDYMQGRKQAKRYYDN